MKEIIKVTVSENQEQTVSGRELHAFLEIETPYTKWFERMLQYGFVAGQDYTDKNVSVLSDGILHRANLEKAPDEFCTGRIWKIKSGYFQNGNNHFLLCF